MSTMGPDELAFHISITTKSDQDKDAINREANRIVEGIKSEYLHRNNTPEMRREFHKAVGNAVSKLPGGEDVRVTPAVTGNPPTIETVLRVDLKAGETSIVETKVVEGKPVPRPPWAQERDDR